jgi:hypothetical protein
MLLTDNRTSSSPFLTATITVGGGDSFEYFGFILKKPPSGTKEHEGTT